MKFFDVGEDAYGVIAIGAQATGFFALGQFANGYILAIGQSAFGFIAIGQLARGVFVVGQLAVGVFTVGQLAFGLHTCMAQLGIAGRKGYGIVLSVWPKPKATPQANAPTLMTRASLEQQQVEEGWLDATVSRDGQTAEVEGRSLSFQRSEPHQRALSSVGASRWRKIWLKLSWQRPQQEVGGYRDETRGASELTMLEYRPQPLPAHLRDGYWAKAVVRSIVLLGMTAVWAYVMAASFAYTLPGKQIPEWLNFF